MDNIYGSTAAFYFIAVCTPAWADLSQMRGRGVEIQLSRGTNRFAINIWLLKKLVWFFFFFFISWSNKVDPFMGWLVSGPLVYKENCLQKNERRRLLRVQEFLKFTKQVGDLLLPFVLNPVHFMDSELLLFKWFYLLTFINIYWSCYHVSWKHHQIRLTISYGKVCKFIWLEKYCKRVISLTSPHQRPLMRQKRRCKGSV